MGKRSKSCTSGAIKTNKKMKKEKSKANFDNIQSEEDELNTKNNEVKTNKSKVQEETKCELVEIVTASHTTLKNKKKTKLRVNKDDSEEKSESAEFSVSSPNKKVRTNKKNKASSNKEPQQNKKIVFTDDEPAEVKDQTNSQKKTKNNDLSQEEDVKDEDIDKFCEEIDEEDNIQYENWVKLIEAKLSSNKKKPK